RHHALTKREVKARVAEHRAHRHGKVEQEPFQAGRVAQHALLEGRDGGEALAAHALANTPAERAPGILAEVVSILSINAFEEPLDLDLLDRVAHTRRAWGRYHPSLA